ncbi:MAG: hypothetical protein ACLRFO_00410 [Alphaproteobacteria bacterium]
MIKTHFVFAVSFVAMFVVSSAFAAAKAVTSTAPSNGAGEAISGVVGTVGDVYDWSEWSGYATEGIASVTYVNKAVDSAGNAAQWAESHAAAAGTAALSAAESATAAAGSAKEAADAVAALDSSKKAASGSVVTGLTITDGKVTGLDEMKLDTVINEANKDSTNAPTTSAVYTAATNAVAALDSSKEAASGSVVTGLTITDGKVTALNEMTLDTAINGMNSNSANAPTTSAVYKFVEGQISTFSENTFADVERRVEELEEEMPDKQAKLGDVGDSARPVYATNGAVEAVTGISIPVGTSTATDSTSWAKIWVE